jgi:serine protease Do
MVATDVTDVVDKVMPSMVAVTNQYEAITNYWGRSYVQDAEASGSGIIVGESDTEFFIATNHHVIDSAKTLTVQFVDGTTASAYVKGSDADIDIAVIAVKKADLSAATIKAVTVAEMGDSDSLNIGEPAIAIGNALGYGQSVTTGVISAVNRKIEDSEDSADGLIQTSAAINPGNSGGALLNTFGQVIGINSSKIGGSTIEGMGFAIPINAVKDLISEYSLRETKERVSEENRGYLGIEGTYDDYSTMGYPKGAFVVKVTEGSAAEAAGIYFGDTITKFDGQTVTGFEGLRDIMSYYKVGDTVDVTLQRNVNGKFEEITVSVTLGKRPAAED